MSKTEKITEEILTVKDEKFLVDHLEKYILSLTIGSKTLKCCVLDPKEKRILWFDHITWEGNMEVEEALEDVYHHHHFLAAGFWKKIIVAQDNPYCTLIPSTLFDDKKSRLVLESTFGPLDADLDPKSKKHPDLGFSTVFATQKKLNDYFTKKYPKKRINFIHASDGILEFATGVSSPEKSTELWLDWTGMNLKTILISNGLPVFYNSFECHFLEDVVYFASLLSEQINTDAGSLSVKLSGDFEESDNLKSLLESFFGEVAIAERPKLFYFGYLFDEVPEHKHLESFSSFFSVPT